MGKVLSFSEGELSLEKVFTCLDSSIFAPEKLLEPQHITCLENVNLQPGNVSMNNNISSFKAVGRAIL